MADYSSFLFLNPLPTWIYDPTTFQLLDINQAAIDQYGYSKDDFLRLTIKDIYLESEIPNLVAIHTEMKNLLGNISFGIFTHQKKSGQHIRMKINGQKIEFQGRESVLVICQDVTEEENRIHQLRLSEERLNAATTIAKLGYWRIELDSNTISWTDEIFKIWGRKRAEFELNFENIFQTIHPDDQKTFEKEHLRYYNGEEEHEFVHRIILPDTRIRWVHELGRLIHDENGNLIAFEGTVQDITAQKEEEHLYVTKQKQKEFEKELLSKISLDFTIEHDLIASANNLCQTISEFGKFDLVELWLPNLENTQIQLLAHQATTPNAESFYKWSANVTSIDIAEGLSGAVWHKKSSIIWEDIGNKADFIRIEAAKKAGIKTVLGIPLLINQEVVGVLIIGTSHQEDYLKKYEKVIERLKHFIGSEINRKKLENGLQHLYDAIADIICITDLQGRFLKINKAGCDLIGHSEEEILFNTFEKFVHSEDIDSSHNDLEKLKNGGKTYGFENRYITKSGEIIWLSWTSNSSIEEGLIYATAKNITAEKKLRELNRMASKLARIGSWEIDLVENKLFWSDMVHEIHETDPKTFAPDLETGINFYREDFRPMVNEVVNKCAETDTPFDFEAVLVTANRNERWVRAIGKAELMAGKCHRIYGSFQDIHDRKEAEVRLQSLADNLPGVVFQYFLYPDGSDGKKYVSKGSEQVWGFSPEAVIENNQLVWNQIKAGGDFEKVQENIRESVKTKSKFNSRWKYMLPNGEVQTHLCYGTPNFLTNGTVIFNAVILDISQEAKNEELLEQATNMARIGSWELDLVHQDGDMMYWSPMTKEIIEVDESYNPSLTGGYEFCTEESKQRIKQAVNSLIQEGKEFDEELLLITTKGTEKWVRCLGKSERIHGKCVRIYGSFQDIHTSKTLELQIREILGSISDAFYALNSNWEFSYFNKKAEKLLDHTEAEVIGKNIWEIFPSALGTLLEETYIRVAECGQPESFEYLRKGDGKWYEVNAYPFNGGVSAYFKNIDERKQSAEKLEKAYREKNNILESIGDAFFAVDRNWTVTYWNKEAENILGKNRDAIVGRNLWVEYADAIDSDFYRQYHSAMATGETVIFEEYYPTMDKWFEVSAYPSEEGLAVYFKDVTLRKKADIRLLEANQRFVKVTEATNDAIWDWDLVNNTFFRSKGIEKFFGEKTEKFIPEEGFWKDKFHPEDLIKIQESIQHSLADPLCSRWEMEYRVLNEQGETIYVIDRGLIVRDGEGKATRMVGAMTDISELKNQEIQLIELNQSLNNYARELERSNEELEQFAFVTSHDLQEPLRMISSFMDQLKRKYGHLLDEKGHQYIHFASDGAKRMKQIILDLLEYSRAGKLIDSVEAVDMKEILKDYQLLRRKVILEKSVKISIGELPIVESYIAPLTQTLHNLLDNAIKYSKKDQPPLINVTAKEFKKYWEISVEDNGIGIEPECFEKVFIIFQRLHNRNQYEGTGIGLSIAKKHVESWGGKIWLESEPGKGSTFYFTLPKLQIK